MNYNHIRKIYPWIVTQVKPGKHKPSRWINCGSGPSAVHIRPDRWRLWAFRQANFYNWPVLQAKVLPSNNNPTDRSSWLFLNLQMRHKRLHCVQPKPMTPQLRIFQDLGQVFILACSKQELHWSEVLIAHEHLFLSLVRFFLNASLVTLNKDN